MIHYGKTVQGKVVSPGGDISHPSRNYRRPLNTVPPVITGTAAVGQVLTSVAGTWLNAATYNWTWERDGTAVQAGGVTYTVVPADAGHSITLVERAYSTAGAGASSRSVAKVIP